MVTRDKTPRKIKLFLFVLCKPKTKINKVMVFCQDCGFGPMPDHSNFCKECGSKLVGVLASESKQDHESDFTRSFTDDLSMAMAESKMASTSASRSHAFSKDSKQDSFDAEKFEAAVENNFTSEHDVPNVVLNYTDKHNQPTPVKVTIHDARENLARGDVSLLTHGFTLAQCPSQLSTQEFYDLDKPSHEAIKISYHEEMSDLIKRETGADKVFILGEQVRNNAKKVKGKHSAFAGGNVAGYASVVHSDYCAKRSAEKFTGADGTSQLKVRYMLLNTWRNISDDRPIYNNSLAVCDATSVDQDRDFRRVDAPLKRDAACMQYNTGASSGDCAEQYRLIDDSARRHRWHYFHQMKKDEVLIFNQYDSDIEMSARFCFHTAFGDSRVDPDLPQRESCEVRAMAIFVEKDPSWGEFNGDLIKQEMVNQIQLVTEPKDRNNKKKLTLMDKLVFGAKRGIIQPAEVSKIADNAALDGLIDEVVLQDVCAEKGVGYKVSDWTS